MIKTYLIIMISSYIIGSIPTAYIIGKIFKGIDIRDFGSGNMGATNIWRTVGKKAAIITLVIDILKGFVPVLIVLFPNI